MTNVVELNPPVDKQVLKTVAVALRTLWMTRTIGTSAYFLGANLLARMQEAGRYMVNATPREIAGEVVYLNNAKHAGHAFATLNEFIDAAQQIHRYAYLLSDLTPSALELPDAHEFHFTLDATKRARVDYTEDTPIWFRFDLANMHEMVNCMNEINQEFIDRTVKERFLEL